MARFINPYCIIWDNYFGWVIAYNGELNGDGTNSYFELYV